MTLLDKDGAPIASTQGETRVLNNLELTALITGVIQTIGATLGPEAVAAIVAIAEMAGRELDREDPSTHEEVAND